ncbi:DNA polymerase III subunit delta' [Maritalea porphyrae]|jgi:DNA polymerase-3 subunit delta'|uniref:DNA polymerase III subunit delta' n=1 Tax=Maritalea porphyrae TaxID=880732 RepID=UPI0022AFCE0B|nr:DNA polymerase III subunit delta' [Maritalea porphyrae]MCZ4273093.1 DNA polymerase III subunit delta' [Maritalea porphyrae]
MSEKEYPAHADQLPGVPPPEMQQKLFGHSDGQRQLLEAYQGGKLHHAWLIAGQKGIGKATFAFDIARKLFSLSGNETEQRVAEMVATGGHPNLKVIRRAFNHKTGKYAANTGVDVVRDAMRFFQTSAATKGLRICIVDSIDDLNANAANALLKTLEEPPANALFLLICNQLGKTLPTIRSRCRLLRLGVLMDQDVSAVVGQIAGPDAQAQLPSILEIARGRPRKALEAVMASSDPTLQALGNWLAQPNLSNDAQLMQLGASIAQSKDEAIWPMALEMLENAIAWRIKHLALTDKNNPALAKAMSVWEKTGEQLRDQAVYNLDKKQTIIMILDAICELDRVAPINFEPST